MSPRGPLLSGTQARQAYLDALLKHQINLRALLRDLSPAERDLTNEILAEVERAARTRLAATPKDGLHARG